MPTLLFVQGPDGRGGRTKVLMSSSQVKTVAMHMTTVVTAIALTMCKIVSATPVNCTLAVLQTYMMAAHQKRGRVQTAVAPVPPIKRYKGPSARGGAAITIQHFFDAAEQDTGCGEEGGPAQQRG
jgi:hypothetical protein